MLVKMQTRDFLNYSQISTSFGTNLDSISHLNEILLKLYVEYFDKETEKLKEIKIEPASDFEIMMSIVQMMNEPINPELDKKLVQLSISSRMSFKNILMMDTKKLQTEIFLRKMSVTHLIIMFEDFLGKNLKLAFLNNPDILKSDSKLSFIDIINLADYDSILEEMIVRKSKDIVKKDINEIGKTLFEFFKLDLINDKDWIKFTEIFYRRHVIVHNKGISDKEYVEHTGNSINIDLTPDDKYIKESLELFRNFAKKITLFFEEKYPDPK